MTSTPTAASTVPPDPRPLAIQPVRIKDDKKRFLDVTRQVYADDPAFVQPVTLERLDHLDPAKNPALRQMEVAYWVAYRGPRPAGRISCQINHQHLQRHHDRTAQFGFFEAIDDPELIGLLLDTAEIWARQRGMGRLQGPFTLSINDESGLLIDGFERRPNMMMPHGRPYYAQRLQDAGYRKAKDLIAYDFDVAAAWPAAAQRLIDRVGRLRGVAMRLIDMKRYDEEIALICDIFNDAWRDNWNFIPIAGEEAAYLAKSLRPVVDANCFVIGEIDGEPAAMCVGIPNLNDAIFDLDGRLLPFGWAKLLWRLKVKGVASWRMPLMGVRKRFQGTLKGAALTLGVIDKIKTYHAGKGVKSAELSWILEDNRAMRDIIETVGGRAYKTYRVFERDIA